MPLEMFRDGVSEGLAEIGGGNDMARFGSTYRQVIHVVVPLAALDTAGGVASWQNPEGVAIMVLPPFVDVTTPASAAAKIDVGTTPTSGTTSSDNLLDGIDVNTAAGVFGQADGDGTNGKPLQKIAAGKWLTASKVSGACAGLVGNLYIRYFRA